MLRKFVKMEGAGNDYIYFDCLREPLASPENLAVRLSDRHRGIGGDGIVLICPSGRADAKMRMFNADGSEGKMCGNAIRCVGKYLFESGAVPKSEMEIETLSGIKRLWLFPEGGTVRRVRVDMGKAEFAAAKIPVNLPAAQIIDYPLRLAGMQRRITCVSMGNPHCVVFEDPDGIELDAVGPLFENASVFPQRVNTEFVQKTGERSLKMRVWERGSGETWACGTGACAAAVAAVLNGYCERDCDIAVHLKGGTVIIRYDSDGTVYMTGDAKTVFQGSVEL